MTDHESLSLIGTDKGFQLAHEFNPIREATLLQNLEEISSYARRNKNPVKGSVIVRDDGGLFHEFKVNRNGYKKNDCEVRITIKNTSDKKKTLTFNEKMELLRNYVTECGKLPESTTIVNDCKLGAFVKKLGVDEEHVQEFVQIKEIITKNAKRK